ncbi:MAG: hypothetical protein RSF75_02305 [Acidaminococcaceae bacterium]
MTVIKGRTFITVILLFLLFIVFVSSGGCFKGHGDAGAILRRELLRARLIFLPFNSV